MLRAGVKAHSGYYGILCIHIEVAVEVALLTTLLLIIGGKA